MKLLTTTSLFGLPLALLAAALLPPTPQDPAEEVPQEVPEDDPLDQEPDVETVDVEKERRIAAQEQDFFEIADYDGNGWISFREAEQSLGVDHEAYAVYDIDRDGRIDRDEFGVRFRVIRKLAGGMPPPLPEQEETLVPKRTSEQLRNAYDRDGDRLLDQEEVRQLLFEYGRREFPPEIVFGKLDKDVNQRLDVEELAALARLLSITYEPEEIDAEALLSSDMGLNPDPGVMATSIEELFGGTISRVDDAINAVPQPPLILGPVTHFRRLDLDNDGSISVSDLLELQSPAQLPVRMTAVISALDLDEDGELDAQEFRAALQRVER